MKKPKYKLFETVIYGIEDSGGGFSVGRIESIYFTQEQWRYTFHDRGSCFEDKIIEEIKNEIKQKIKN